MPSESTAPAPPVAVPLTPGARAALAARALDPLAADVATLACEPPGMPAMLATPHAIEFIDQGDRIVLRFHEWGSERIVYMNPRNGPAVVPHSPFGVSFGRWEGATLAIFTLYISYPYFDANGTPQSNDVTVLERYTPRMEGELELLDWMWRVTDPATFTEPVVRTGVMVLHEGAADERWACAPHAAQP